MKLVRIWKANIHGSDRNFFVEGTDVEDASNNLLKVIKAVFFVEGTDVEDASNNLLKVIKAGDPVSPKGIDHITSIAYLMEVWIR